MNCQRRKLLFVVVTILFWRRTRGFEYFWLAAFTDERPRFCITCPSGNSIAVEVDGEDFFVVELGDVAVGKTAALTQGAVVVDNVSERVHEGVIVWVIPIGTRSY